MVIMNCIWVFEQYVCVYMLSGAEETFAYKMLRSVSCCKQFLLLETLLQMDSGNCRIMIPLLMSSKMLYCTDLQKSGTGSRTFHTNVWQRQLKEKASERHNSLIEAKDKPFSELTFGEKGEKVEIKGSS